MEFNEIKKRAPWNKKSDWERLLSEIKKSDRTMGQAFEPVRRVAMEIRQQYTDIAESIGFICRETCPDCRDNCCERATLWYDFKDLLYIYFTTGKFPGDQIYKKRYDGYSACCHLTETGCVLPRTRRPFVCTWYFCPGQKKYGVDMDSRLQKIKKLRKQLEEEFIKICQSN